MRKIIRRAAAVLLSAALLLTGTASAAAQIDPVEERLAAMSLREKVGQLFVVRVEALDPSGQSDSTRLTWAERQGLKKYPVGGIVVFRQNVKSPEQLKKLLADFQAASGIGLLTAVDEEGGSVARLANASGFDLPQYQSAQAVGTTGDPANARAMGQIIGGYLKTYGLNLDFARVADVITNPDNTVIGNRAFSSDPAVAAQMVASAAGAVCFSPAAFSALDFSISLLMEAASTVASLKRSTMRLILEASSARTITSTRPSSDFPLPRRAQ